MAQLKLWQSSFFGVCAWWMEGSQNPRLTCLPMFFVWVSDDHHYHHDDGKWLPLHYYHQESRFWCMTYRLGFLPGGLPPPGAHPQFFWSRLKSFASHLLYLHITNQSMKHLPSLSKPPSFFRSGIFVCESHHDLIDLCWHRFICRILHWIHNDPEQADRCVISFSILSLNEDWLWVCRVPRSNVKATFLVWIILIGALLQLWKLSASWLANLNPWMNCSR